ncbi:MAG: hypothetical protein ABSC31_16315 [Acidimicrobiales bacterium]
MALDLARHQPPGDVETVWLEWRESLGTAEPGIVGSARRRGELSRAVRTEHQDPDAEVRAPAQGVKADHAGSIQDHEAAEPMGGPVVAASAPVRSYAVVDFEGAVLDDHSHAKAVGDTDTSEVGPTVGLGECSS